jgi:hypothetical protein
LTQLDERLWTVEDDVPGLRGAHRRMTVLKRADGTLLFYNAIPVSEEMLAQVRALGTPAQLIIPNQYHALDAAAFTHRLGLTAFAPAVAVDKLAPQLKCRPVTELPLEPSLRLFTVDGFTTHEAILVVGKTLIVADLITNAPHEPGLAGLMMRLVGFTGPQPRLPFPVRKRVGGDLAAVRALMTELAGLEGLARIIPSHGGIVETNAPEVLKAVASSF